MVVSEIVVTGTRTAKLLADTPIATQVISAADIRHTDATNMQELLTEMMPGVEFSYAMNQQTHANINGFSGRSILFLVDGERLAGETLDDVDFARLSTANVGRIEIVRGAASAIYGSNANGGVINLITHEDTNPWRLTLDSRLGRHNAWRHRAVFSTHGKRLSQSFTLSRTATDNYRLDNAANPVAPVVSTVYGDKTWDFRERLTYTPSDCLQLTARAGYFFREQKRSVDTPQRYRDFSGGLRARWTPSDYNQLELSYAFDQYDKSDFHTINHLDVRRYSNVQNTLRALFSHTSAGGHVLTVGSDYLHDYLLNANLGGRSCEQDAIAAFAEYDHLLTDRWEAIGALRYDYFSDSRNAHLTQLNLRYKASPHLQLRMGYAMGFRAPSLKERYYDFDMAGIWIVRGNQDLRSEVSHNWHAGAEYTHGKYHATLDLNYDRISNKIATGLPHRIDPMDSQLYLDYINLNHYSVYGAALHLQAQWTKSLSTRLSYTYTHEQQPHDADGNTASQQYIPARPHAATARMDWTAQAWRQSLQLSLSTRFSSSVDCEQSADYYDASLGTVLVHYPAYMIWKVNASQQLGKAFRLNIAVDNIFNYRPTHYYANSPVTDGTNLSIGIAADFNSLR